MEKNIFENAYFGKEYKTRDNTIVKFIFQRYGDDFSIYIPKCKYSVETTHRYNSKGEFYLGDGEYGHGALDIVSEWIEPIDEEKLDELAEEYFLTTYNKGIKDPNLDIINEKEYAIADYKAGYRKAYRLQRTINGRTI